MQYYLGAWYIADWSANLGKDPIGRTLMDRPVVLYRGEGGEPIALGGVCPHRFAPLADGKVQGNAIECPYHGLQFDQSGACVLNPNGDGFIPPATRVPSYPVVEKNGAIWIWMGNPAEADPELISDTDWLVSSSYAAVQGYLRIEAHYELVVDNLLDLTHAPRLHPTTVGGDPEDARGMKHEFHTDDRGVIHSNYLVEGMPKPSPQLLPFWGANPGDFRAEMRWRPACTLELDIRMSPMGSAKYEGIHIPSLHYLVPESDQVTHYFFAMGRNVVLDNPEVSKLMLEGARQAFEDEDEPMIRKCQQAMPSNDLLALKPVILRTDIAGVQARRTLAKLIKNQAAAPVG